MHSSDIVRAAQYRLPIAENIIINDIDDETNGGRKAFRFEFTSSISSPISNPPDDDAIPFGLSPAMKHAILFLSRWPANDIPIFLYSPWTQGKFKIMKNFNSMMEWSNGLRIVATVDGVTQYRP